MQWGVSFTKQVRLVPVQILQAAGYLDEAPLPARGIRPELCQGINGRLSAKSTPKPCQPPYRGHAGEQTAYGLLHVPTTRIMLCAILSSARGQLLVFRATSRPAGGSAYIFKEIRVRQLVVNCRLAATCLGTAHYQSRWMPDQ